jgi:maleate isomerase
MLVPSSNTVLEPVTARLLVGFDDVSVHASRFRVTEIALGGAAQAQFDPAPILAAAELLAHAKCNVIAWNGTSASWLGFHRDEELAAQIKASTGIPATTCVLGYRDLLRRHGWKRIGLVTPYTADVQGRIATVWGGQGFDITAERHLGIADNFSFGLVTEAEIETMIRAVAAERVDAIVILCTNLRGAVMAPRLEAELSTPILDSVAVTLWAALDAAGARPERLARFGQAYRP